MVEHESTSNTISYLIMPTQVIEYPANIDIRHPKNTSFAIDHNIEGGLSSGDYKMIINEGKENEIESVWVKTWVIVQYSFNTTQMTGLGVGEHQYVCRYVEGSEINPVYMKGAFTTY